MAVGGNAAPSGEGEAERHLLEEELHDAECTLLGEVQQIERLAQENNSKVEELRRLKDDVRMLKERNEYHVTMLHDEHATHRLEGTFSSAQQELAHRLTVLREQATQLSLKHERYKETSRLNEAAGAEVESLLRKMEKRTKAHGEDVHTTRQEVLLLRQELESTFRKTLKDLGGTYRRKAFKALGSPAKEGMRANKLLREEMALQEVGVAALSERHVQESKRGKEVFGQLKRLRHSKLVHQSSLADLQREARENASSFADIQETKTRISEARQSLKRELNKQGVPARSLSEIHEMALKEKEETRLLEKLKLRWQRRTKELISAILPSSSETSLMMSSATSGAGTESSFGSTSQISSSSPGSTTIHAMSDSVSVDDVTSLQRCTLRGSKSAPPGLQAFLTHGDVNRGLTAAGGMSKKQAAEAAWQARVERVTNKWAKDGVDHACFGRVGKGGGGGRGGGGGPHRDRDRDPSDASGKKLRPAEDVASGQREMPLLKGNRSASSPALGGASPPSTSSSPTRMPHPTSVSAGFTMPFGTLVGTGSASTGALHLNHFHGVLEENPWEKKRRMERAIRRRDASIRAKGLAVNSNRVSKVSCQMKSS